uniref:Uncharacterized protein n=1 Tax=Phlebotomus papatasi TaxID=29031 RepID=A0A1B0D1Q4_PHLPP
MAKCIALHSITHSMSNRLDGLKLAVRSIA